MRFVSCFLLLLLVNTAAAQQVEVESSVARQKIDFAAAIERGEAYIVFGRCPTPQPEPPAEPPKFDFPDEDVQSPDVAVQGDNNLTVILSVIAALGGAAAGYVGTRAADPDAETPEPDAE